MDIKAIDQQRWWTKFHVTKKQRQQQIWVSTYPFFCFYFHDEMKRKKARKPPQLILIHSIHNIKYLD